MHQGDGIILSEMKTCVLHSLTPDLQWSLTNTWKFVYDQWLGQRKVATWEKVKSLVNMVLLRYLQPIEGLPDPKDPLSSKLLLVHFSRAYLSWLFSNSLSSKVAFIQLQSRCNCCLPYVLVNTVSTRTQLLLVLCNYVSTPSLCCQLSIVSNFCWMQIFVVSLTHQN